MTDAEKAELERMRKLVHKLGKAIELTCDHLEDEGDRIFLGSTNHADALKDANSAYQSYCFDAGTPMGYL